MYGTVGGAITRYMVIYGAYVRIWPTLNVIHKGITQLTYA